jgi:hypothetical protein
LPKKKGGRGDEDWDGLPKKKGETRRDLDGDWDQAPTKKSIDDWDR